MKLVVHYIMMMLKAWFSGESESEQDRQGKIRPRENRVSVGPETRA